MSRKRRVAIWTLVVGLAMVICIPLFSTSSYAATSSHAATGWVVGDNVDGYGTILHTTDGGNTWIRQGSTEEVPNVPLSGVSAIDANTAWVVGEPSDGYGVILHTTDGGNTWERQGSTEDVPNVGLFAVSAIDANTAWVVGNNGTILHTIDGGNTWIQQKGGTVPVVLLQGVSAVDANTAWVTGDRIDGYGTILHTTDGGNTWERQGSTEEVPNVPLLAVSAIDANTAWIAGHDFTILHTKDGGDSWETQMSKPGFGFDANGVCAVDSNTVWVVADLDGIFHTTDGGENWITQSPPVTGYYLQRVSAIDANTAWIAGIFFGPSGGVILHTTDGGNTWENQTPEGEVGLCGVSFVTRPNVKFKGVVIGDPNLNNTVGINGVNVLLYDVISSDVPEAFLHVGEVVTVTWPISGQFAGTTTYFLETVEVYGSYMDEPMPETWSEVGKAWVSLSADDHYLNEIKFEALPILEWSAIILAIVAIIIALFVALRSRKVMLEKFSSTKT
ncbi:MAG: hypothetical protein H3Z49_06385 [archaeon]|nr:hypothetical protein [archaeon]